MAMARLSVPTKADAAYQAIRDAIREGQMRPGERIILQNLARDLGMSLTPVREALRILASQGLIEQTPNQSAVVTDYTLERAEEVYRLRLVLEPLAAELAATNANEGDLDAINQAHSVLEDAIKRSDETAIPQLNADLHSTIYRAAKSPYLIEFIERLWNGVPFQALSLSTAKPASSREHTQIVNAIRRGDPTRAASLMRDHISRAKHHTLAQLSEAGEEPRPVGR